MSTCKEAPLSEDPGIKTIIQRVRLPTNGLSEEDMKKIREIKRVHDEVVGQFRNDSKKLCEISEYHNAKLEESVGLPNLVKKPLVEKAAHLMAESAFANVRVKNSLGADKKDKHAIISLLEDLGVKEKEITQDTLGLITVLEKREYKNPETVVYSRLHERYLQQLRTVLKE